MRISIDVRQAPGSSFVHLMDIEALERAIEGFCTDEFPSINIVVEPALDEDISL